MPDLSEIKIEIFYENSTEHSTYKTDPSIKIFGIQIGFEMQIFDKGELIGSKMSALPLETIGVVDRPADIPKHIYDIATLLKTGCTKTTIVDILLGFRRACEEEISYFTNNDPPTYNQILYDLTNSICSILNRPYSQ